MYGATRSATSFRTEVGIGSAAEDLPGSRRINELTSSTVVLRNVDSDDDDVIRVNVGGDESAVARTANCIHFVGKVMAVLIVSTIYSATSKKAYSIKNEMKKQKNEFLYFAKAFYKVPLDCQASY